MGDSRLYEVGPEQVTPMTVDHVPATAFAMGGLLDEREWWQQVHGEHRAQISQALFGEMFASPPENLHVDNLTAVVLRVESIA